VNRLEDRLRDAFAAAAATVSPESVGYLHPRPGATRARRLAPLAAAAAVALIVVGASISASLALTLGNHGQPASTGVGHASRTRSAGPSGAVLAVPMVTGMSFNEAAATLQAIGLRVAAAPGAATPAPQGTVIAQNPVPGAQLPAGATVTVTVTGSISSSARPGISPLVTVSAYAVTISIPPYWRPTPDLGLAVGYDGVDGWVQLRSADYPSGLRAACTGIAGETAPYSYGSDPQVEYRRVDGRPACVIVPSHDAPGAFQLPGVPSLPAIAAVVDYRSPLPGGANFLVINADPPHLMGILSSVQLHH
jgi:hypothetical protein